MYKFQTTLGSQKERPLEIDTTSSEYVVYIRRNIEPYENTDKFGSTFKGWKYEEVAVPNNDFLADFVKQLIEENQQLKKQIEEDNLTIMMGMADIYETKENV